MARARAASESEEKRVIRRVAAGGCDLTRLDQKTLLSDHFLFSELEPPLLERLLHSANPRVYAKGETVFTRGEEGERLFAILRGRVKVSVFSEEGREVVLAVMKPGDFFGEIAFLDGSVRTADATAIEEMEVISVGRRDFLPILETHPAIYMKIIRVLCERLRMTNETIEDSIFLTVPARVAKTLIKLSHSYGEDLGGRTRINIKMSQQEMANLIGTSREVVNRHLRALQADSVISMDQGHIVIEDMAALEDYAQVA